jgi:drug/metabolite transporter (DMT)-like permease
MYLWMRARGASSPTMREWQGASLLAVLFFVFDYGLVFWAETRVPSGMTAVMMAMIPAFMALSEIVFMKTQRVTLRLTIALLMGLAGVGVLVSRSATFGDVGIDPAGAIALLVATVSWSVASALARKVPLPASKAMSSGVQMLAGGVLLTIAAGLLGEFRGFHLYAVSSKAWLALIYLIIAGSIVAFTAYVWLIHHESPTRVGTYAYVNPVVAVVLGYFFAGEALGPRTIVGTLLVLVSVVVITTGKRKTKEASQSSKAAAAAQLRTEN